VVGQGETIVCKNQAPTNLRNLDVGRDRGRYDVSAGPTVVQHRLKKGGADRSGARAGARET